MTRRPDAALSPREVEVVDLLRAGLVPKEIAARLGISLWTVRSHLDSARRRTETRTTTQLVAVFARTRERRRTT